jgi:hypothetical protein
MAPEQARGEVEGTDERADIYALGRMLAALLGDMGDLPAGLPRPLAGICARATAAAPADRYPSVGGMADETISNNVIVANHTAGGGERWGSASARTAPFRSLTRRI